MHAASSSRNCSTRVRAWRLKSGGSDRFSRTGSSREPSSSASAMRAGEQEDADIGELEIAEARAPSLERGLVDEHVHRRSGQRQHRAGMGPEDQRHQQLRWRPFQPHRQHHDDGQQGRDRSVDADQGREHAAEQHHQHDEPRPAVARAARQHLAGPGGQAGLLQRPAHHEERCHEHRCRVAEARKRLVQRQHAEAQSAIAHPTQTAMTGSRSQMNSADDRHDDREDDPDVGQMPPIRAAAPPSARVAQLTCQRNCGPAMLEPMPRQQVVGLINRLLGVR